jgi:hypothetical protein
VFWTARALLRRGTLTIDLTHGGSRPAQEAAGRRARLRCQPITGEVRSTRTRSRSAGGCAPLRRPCDADCAARVRSACRFAARPAGSETRTAGTRARIDAPRCLDGQIDIVEHAQALGQPDHSCARRALALAALGRGSWGHGSCVEIARRTPWARPRPATAAPFRRAQSPATQLTRPNRAVQSWRLVRACVAAIRTRRASPGPGLGVEER